MKKNLTTLFMLLFVVGSSFAQIYVDAAAADGGNGQTWATAYNDLQTAINAAVAGDEIRVAKGFYRPTVGTGRAKTITIGKSLTIKGSYNTATGLQEIPTGLAPSAINAGNATILSGDLQNDEVGDVNLNPQTYYYTQNNGGTNLTSAGDDNAFNVVTITAAAGVVTLNGLFITAGNAYEAYTSTEIASLPAPIQAAAAAAGKNNYNTNPATSSGAGLKNEGTLILTDCQFAGNFATVNGGALNSTTAITATRVSFTANAAAGIGSDGFGGAVNTAGGTFNAVSFIRNGAAVAGGGLYTTNGATLNNVAFAACQTNNGGTGAGVHNASGTLTATNCTFVGGSAVSGTVSGSAIYNAGTCTVVNSIVDNSNDNFAGTTNTGISYSIIDGTAGTATLGTGMLTGDPMIIQPNPNTAGFDLNLKQGSLCINMGDKAAATTAGLTTDIQGSNRFYCDEVDMGAAERSNGRGLLTRDQVAVFNGSASVLLGTGANSFTNSAFTIEAWVKPTVLGGTILSNSQITLGINGSGNVTFAGVTGATALALNEWYHVAATSAGKIYINGKDEGVTASVTPGTSAVTIGSGLNGQLEEVRIWADVRTEAEIRKNMRLLMPCGAENALATYEFNGDAKTALEFSYITSNNYDGTATGVTYSSSMLPISHGNSRSFASGSSSVSLTGRNNTSINVAFTGGNPNGEVVVSYLGQAPSGAAPWNDRMGVNYQYVIDNYGATQTFNYTATLSNNAYDFSGVAADYKLERRDANATGDWDVMDGTSGAERAVSNSTPNLVFTVTGLKLGQLLPTKGANLPVEMTTFTATLEGAAVVLDWQTATEENNAGFEVNRSTDAKTWEKIGFVEGNGTVYNAQNYQFRDAAPKTGVNYYRLRQVDFDGAFAFSDVRSVLVSGKAAAISFAPNPTEGNLWINLAEVNETATVQVYDLTGRLLINEIADAKNPQFALDLSALDNGLYIVQVKGTNWQTTEKVLVKH